MGMPDSEAALAASTTLPVIRRKDIGSDDIGHINAQLIAINRDGNVFPIRCCRCCASELHSFIGRYYNLCDDVIQQNISQRFGICQKRINGFLPKSKKGFIGRCEHCVQSISIGQIIAEPRGLKRGCKNIEIVC